MLAGPSDPAARSFIFPVRVYYEDTDAGGVVYYANYLKYLERARTEWLRSLGIDQSRLLAERDVAFVVRALTADFRKPAVLDDLLTVTARIERLGGASLQFAQRVLRGDEILFDALVTIASVHLSQRKPAPLPPDIRACLKACL